jgi:hypothetical protein
MLKAAQTGKRSDIEAATAQMKRALRRITGDRRRTGLNADKAGRLLLKEWQDMATFELAAYDYLPFRADAMDLKKLTLQRRNR